MAQGCHLIYSHSDREHFPLNTSIERPTVDEVASQFKTKYNLNWNRILPSQDLIKNEPSGIKIDENRAEGIYKVLHGTLQTFNQRFEALKPMQQSIISGLLTTRTDQQSDIITGLGNPELNHDMARNIPDALDRLLKHDKNCSGLFNKVRKGESTWISNLKNTGTGKANGIAYEVLASAKMIHSPIKGRPISIYDHLDFGPKLQASYGGGGDIKVSDGEKESIFSQPHRTTVEADLLITQPPPPLGGGKEIAVDFKHSASKANVTEQQMEGVAVALKTGEVDEWHFVCNKNFNGTVHKNIQEINAELKADNKPTIKLHENYDWR